MESVNLYKYLCENCDAVWNITKLNDESSYVCTCGQAKLRLLSFPQDTNPPLRLQGKSNYKDLDSELQTKFLTALKSKEVNEASELLVSYIKEKLYIYTTKNDLKSEMWVYKDGIYVPNGKSEVKELLRKVLGPAFNTFHFNNTIAKLEADTFIEVDEFFKITNIEEVPVLNGILNIFTRKLSPFTHHKIFFSKLPVKFDENAKCPEVERFLETVLPYNEDKNIIYELGGFALLKEYKYEKAFMLVGDGRNGKGKTIELIKRVIGSHNCTSLPLTSLVPESASISELFGKMLNLAGDIANTDLKDTSMFKALTGRDLVNGKRKYMVDISFTNFAKFVFACNELPMVYDVSKGFWDRWVLLEFPYTFVDQNEYDKAEDKSMLKIKDADIINKISTPQELSGLLNKFLEGLQRLEKNKTFSTTRGSNEVKDTWVRKSNSFIAFCFDNLLEDYEGKIVKKELRKRYSLYCKKHKVSSKTDFVIKTVLQSSYGVTEGVKSIPFGDSYIKEHIWEGVKWKD